MRITEQQGLLRTLLRTAQPRTLFDGILFCCDVILVGTTKCLVCRTTYLPHGQAGLP